MRDGHASQAKGRPRLSDAPFALSSKDFLLIALPISVSTDVGRTAFIRVEATDLGASEDRLIGSAGIPVASGWLSPAGGRKTVQRDCSLARRQRCCRRRRIRIGHLARGLFLCEERFEKRSYPRRISGFGSVVDQGPSNLPRVNIW